MSQIYGNVTPTAVAPPAPNLTVSVLIEQLNALTQDTFKLTQALAENLSPILYQINEKPVAPPPGRGSSGTPMTANLDNIVGQVTSTNYALEIIIRSLAL